MLIEVLPAGSGMHSRTDQSDRPSAFTRVSQKNPGQARVFKEAIKRNYQLTCFFNQSVGTDFGRVMGYPMARETTDCAVMPSARLTLKSTV